ncbi:MAG: 16S rRNA (uracil(1498)-N(3))-methyltransferase [Fusobacterium sp. JB019]|nr:16S rRNA (uracil(1498)-N(3))-methyltransferase [Fusobacterium sp. JB020]MDP0506416.1 16S rRNA (uracil(1498)-N(3))-methyltransferase [Fusobacterium sp. JB019]
MITVVIGKENIFSGEIIVKDKKDINHLKNSFRIKEKDEVRAVDGEKEYFCSVQLLEKKEIKLKILSEKEIEKDEIKVEAGISIIKNDRMELVIQKLTEIGIDKILPLETKRTIVKLKEKKEKWDVVSKEAIKQCQRVNFLDIDEITKLKDISYENYDLVIVPYENEENYSLKELLKEEKKKIKKVLYIIGPEGGFSEEEIEGLKELENSKIVTLGRNILRAETAAIVVGGILINEFK